MPKKSKKIKGRATGHFCPIDPLAEEEARENRELPGKMHELAEKPTKLPKKIRAGKKESYHPFR